MTDQVEFRIRPAAWLARVAVALAFAASLAACDTADYTVDWFDGDDEEETAAEDNGDGASGTEGGSQQPTDRPFPNLSSVPERPGPPEIKLEAVSVKEGLTADKNNARYTDQALRSQTANVRPRPPAEKRADAQAAASTGPRPADRAARPSAPPSPAPGTPAAERAASQPEKKAQPAQPQVAAKAPAVSPSSPPSQRPQPIGKEAPAPKAGTPTPKAETVARPAPPPEPVTQDSAPRRARPAPPPVAAATAPAAPAPAAPAPAQQVTAAAAPAPPAAPQISARAGTTTLVATIYFADGQTALTAEDLAVLRQVMEIQRQGGGSLRVVGHSSMSSGIADPTRRRLVNFKVSLDRATIVARNFTDMGLPSDRVAVEAQGDAQPIYSEETAAGAAGNRRAEIFLDF